jgi:SAM-dependent methyltransferase
MINEALDADTYKFAEYYDWPRKRLLDLLDIAPTAALEVGCGGGATLAEIKRRFPSCRTVGVELRGEAAEIARRRPEIDQTVIGSVLEEGVAQFEPGQFDLIVFSHVLEHFPDPDVVLRRSLDWLAPNGRLLIALPNVRHVTVLYDLIVRADFRYRESGIMDNTHLRFYTRKSAERMMGECGLEVLGMDPDIDGRKYALVNRWTFGRAEGIAAKSYNWLARRRG